MTRHVLYVVPTFNRARDLPRTLGAIAAQRWPATHKSILVVDNSSTDDTPAVLAELARTLPCPLEHLRKAPEGPTVARNIGLRRGCGGYVALIDSDVELDPGWTEVTAAALDADPTLAQASGKLVFGHDPSILNSFGGVTGYLGLCWDRGEGMPADSETAPRDVLWINTSAVLMRPEAALAVGGFDESFFYAYEEPDLGLRLAISGWRARVLPEAIALHHADVRIVPSHPDFVFHYTKNRFRMGLKTFALPRLSSFILLNVAYGLADALLHRPRGARLRAILWNIANLGDALRLRRQAQAMRRVDDEAVLGLLDRRWFPPQRLFGLRRRTVPGSTVTSGTDDRVFPAASS